MWPFNIKLNPNTALRRTIDGRASFYSARLFFVVLGVQNWVPIEHGHIYRIINTSDNTTQCNVKSTHRTSAEKIIWTQACLFCCLFCCWFFLVCFFFWGGGGAGGWGLVCCFLGGWNTTQRDVNAVHRTSECYSWQRKFDRRWFVCFVFFVCLFFGFYFIFIIFRGRGLVELIWGWCTGYRLSQLCSEHCITENFSAISFSVCFVFSCGLVCLFFFKPLQYFGAPENIKKWTYHSVKPPDFCTMPLLYSGLQNSKTFSQPASTW